MLEQTQARLNQSVFVGYYLDTPGQGRSQTRVRITDVLNRRAGMDVSGLGPAHGNVPVRSASPAGPAAPGTRSPSASAMPLVFPQDVADSQDEAGPQDEVEHSAAGPMQERQNETPEARAERLARIKNAIENGEYDTDDKLEAALSRLFEVHGIDFDD